MNKFFNSSILGLFLISCNSFAADTQVNYGLISSHLGHDASAVDAPIMTKEQFKTLQQNAAYMKIPTIQQRENSHKFIANKTLEKLNELKRPDDKLAFSIAMNETMGGGFHVNDNYLLNLGSADKEYFDAFYMSLLFTISQEIKSGKKGRDQIIRDYEKKYPFRIYENDLKRFEDYEKVLNTK